MGRMGWESWDVVVGEERWTEQAHSWARKWTVRKQGDIQRRRVEKLWKAEWKPLRRWVTAAGEERTRVLMPRAAVEVKVNHGWAQRAMTEDEG